MLAVCVFHAGSHFFPIESLGKLIYKHIRIHFSFVRPPWNAEMTVEELDTNERQAFLAWRRNLARSGFKIRVHFPIFV